VTLKASKILSDTALYGFSMALMKGMSLLILPFVVKHLTQEGFGTLEILSSLAIIGSIFASFGLEEVLFKFAGQENNESQRKRISAQVFCLALIIGAAVFGLSCLFAPYIANIIPGAATAYDVSLILAVISLEAIIAVPLGWLRMRDLVSLFCFASVGRALLHAFLVLAFLSKEATFTSILEAGCIAAICQAIFLGVIQFLNF
jgi:O-antigen/teichoic acid export membrane protein